MAGEDKDRSDIVTQVPAMTKALQPAAIGLTRLRWGCTMTTTTYAVTGMTCGHCVHAVTGELSGLEGVSKVDVDLVPGGQSRVTVTSEAGLPEDGVAAALDEAGDYRLAG